MPRRRFRRVRAPFAIGLVLLIGGLAACGGSAAPSFAPEGPCAGDGAAPGTYPALEALIPTSFENQPPTRLDSGRTCTANALATLAAHGITDVRYAGGLWDLGSGRGVALAVFEAEGLDAERMFEFYEAGAKASERTTILATSTPTIASRPGHRIDADARDNLQTIVVWPSATPDRVNVVLTSDFPEPKIQAAVDAFGDD